MSGAAPWSVKGIEPRTREVAKDLARRSGMTLGEWLSEMIADSGDENSGPERRYQPRRYDDAYSMRGEDATAALRSIEALSSRLEGAERRSTTAIDGIDRAVAGLVRRLEAVDAETSTRDRRIDELSDSLREGRSRLRHFEDETGPRYTEAFGKIEGAIGKLAGQFYDAEARGRDSAQGLRDRLDRLERGASSDRLVDGVVSQVASRLEEAQGRTTQSLAKLEQSFADLDRRLARTEAGGGQSQASGLEKLAETLTRKVEDSRAEMMRRLDTAASDSRMDKVERALAELGAHLQESERRQAQALEAMGREVMNIAANLDGRLKQTEQSQEAALVASQEKALKAVETMGQELSKSLGADVARVADAIEHRLRRADDHHAMALEKLGGEITRISERLAERIAQSDRSSAQGVGELTEKLNRASEKMESRYERASGELAERMRQSEERTAKLLAEARDSIDKQLAKRGGGDWTGDAFPSESFSSDWSEPGVAQTEFSAADVFETADDVFAPEQTTPALHVASALGSEPTLTTAALDTTTKTNSPVVDPFTQIDEPSVAAAPSAPFAPTTAEPSPFTDVADELDAFDPATEFLTDRHGQAERPLSTREAIEAARAATRRAEGSANQSEAESKSFGFRLGGGGKSRLQKRMDNQTRREGSTIRKALAATTTAALIVGFGAVGVVGYQRLVAEGSAIPGLSTTDGASLAAAATSPSEVDIAPPAAEAQAEAQGLFDQASPLLESGDAEGVRLMSRAANLGLPQAQFVMARLYENGEAGVTADPAEARRWTERAARGGEIRAMHNLALYLFEGTGGVRDQAQALHWFEAAAERGLTDSQYNLARLYERGVEGVSPDLAKAYQWYLVAGRAGDAGAEEAAARLRSELPPSQRLSAESEAERFRAGTAQG